MTPNKQAIMVLACDRHSGEVARLLDQERVHDWVIIPAGQARRLGHLAFRSPEHERTCDVVLGFVDPSGTEGLQRGLEREVHAGAVCSDCVIYTWSVTEMPVAQAAICPVCQMTVDQTRAEAVVHEGRIYYFCCPDCRKRFLANPHAFAGQAG